MNKYMLLMLVCTAFSAVSQILLKQSANQEHESILKEYLVISENSPAVLAYLTSAGCVSFADTGQYIIFRYENSGATT